MACLSAPYTAERHDDLHALLAEENFWPYKRWTVRALAAQGKNAAAVQLAEASRSPWASDWDIDRLCEEILLPSGMVDDAYARYGLTDNRRGTYVGTFRGLVPSVRQVLPLLPEPASAARGPVGVDRHVSTGRSP